MGGSKLEVPGDAGPARPVPVWKPSLDARASDREGYPVMAFEEWFQRGLDCHRWNLPRALVKQAFRRLSRDHAWGLDQVRMWQIRAFVYGCRGGYDEARRCLAPNYTWPLPSDPAWALVVFIYRDGLPVLDWLHPVSARFWSEDNEPFELPEAAAGELDRSWFARMGFDVLDEWPPHAAATVRSTGRPCHLSVVR